MSDLSKKTGGLILEPEPISEGVYRVEDVALVQGKDMSHPEILLIAGVHERDGSYSLIVLGISNGRLDKDGNYVMSNIDFVEYSPPLATKNYASFKINDYLCKDDKKLFFK